MEELDLLKKSGLSESQAKVYYCLLSNGKMTPNDISEKVDESRENCYAVLKKLVTLGLVEQTADKKATYRATNPSNLEVMVEKRRKIMMKNEQLVKGNISSFIELFYKNNIVPGSRTLEGIEGIKESFMDILRTKKNVYLLRTPADEMLGKDSEYGSFLKEYRDKLPLLGIHTYALTPYSKLAAKNVVSGRDRAINFHRIWMPADTYTSPVAIQVYGDKVAFIEYSSTPMVSIITSPTTAESLRQIIKIMMEFYKKSFPQEEI